MNLDSSGFASFPILLLDLPPFETAMLQVSRFLLFTAARSVDRGYVCTSKFSGRPFEAL
jgi:hypothetical protein